MFWSRSLDGEDSGARRGPWLSIFLVLTSATMLVADFYLEAGSPWPSAWSAPLAVAAALVAVLALVIDMRR